MKSDIDMKRILIVGSAASGKSTLATRLHDILGLPIIHLDQHYFGNDWRKPTDYDWEKIVKKLVKNDEWIMDGNYRKTLDLRIPSSDTIVLLDFPRHVCLVRAFKRRLMDNRLDPIDGCKEKISFNFLKWILWGFPHVSKKLILKKFGEIENEKKVFILKSNRDVENFINSIKKQ